MMREQRRVRQSSLLFLLFLLVASPLRADFKIMGGVSFSRYGISPEAGGVRPDYTFGWAGGIGFEKNLNYLMLLELDILYFQKGSSLESSDAAYSETKYRLNVLSLPILLRAKLLYESSPYMLGGVEFSSVLSHKMLKKDQEPVDLKASTRSLDFAFVLGCGYEIKIEEHLFFFIEARYHLGSRNIMVSTLDGESRKTRAVVILVGLRS